MEADPKLRQRYRRAVAAKSAEREQELHPRVARMQPERLRAGKS